MAQESLTIESSGHLFSEEVRQALREVDLVEAPIKIGWFKSQSGRRGTRAFNLTRRIGATTLGDLADLQVDRLRLTRGAGEATVTALQAAITRLASLAPDERAKWYGRDAPKAPVKRSGASARPLRPLWLALGRAWPERRLARMQDILEQVSTRDIRFGWPTVAPMSWRELLGRSANYPPLDEVRERLEALERIVLSPQPLMAELVDLLGPPTRNASILRQRWGWTANGDRTLKAIGEPLGLTRERVRQIINRESKRFRGGPAYLPTTRRILAIAEELGNDATEERISTLALDRGLIDRAEDIRALPVLFDLGLLGSDPNSGTTWPDSEELLREYGRLAPVAQRELRRRDVSSLADLVSAARAAGLQVEDERMRSVLKRMPGVVALEAADFFWLSGTRVSATMAKIRKPLVILGPMPANAIARALRRALARSGKHGPRVPVGVLEEVLSRSPFMRVTRDGRFEWVGPVKGVAPSRYERVFLDVIQSRGPVATYYIIREAVRARGLNGITGGIYLGMTPLLDRPARGVYHLLGARVSAEDIARARSLSPSPGQRHPKAAPSRLTYRRVRNPDW